MISNLFTIFYVKSFCARIFLFYTFYVKACLRQANNVFLETNLVSEAKRAPVITRRYNVVLFQLRGYTICPNGLVCEDNDEQACCPPVSPHPPDFFTSVSSTDFNSFQGDTNNYWFSQWYVTFLSFIIIKMVNQIVIPKVSNFNLYHYQKCYT